MTSALVLDNTGSKVSSWLRWKCFVLPVTPAHCTLPGGCWRSLWRSLLLSCTLVLARIEYMYLCQNILFETSRIQETYYLFLVLFLKKHSKDTNWRSKHKPVDFESTSSKDVLNPAIARAGTDRRVTVDTATPLAAGAGVLVCCDTRRCDESCLTLLTCSLEVVKSKA